MGNKSQKLQQIEFEFQQFAKYVSYIGTWLYMEAVDFEQYAESDDSYADDFESISEYFHLFFYNGFLVSFYSHFEQSLAQACRLIESTAEGEIEKLENSRGLIKSAKRQLSRFDPSLVVDADWEHLFSISKVRNVIVHNSGMYPPHLESELLRHQDRFEGLHLDGSINFGGEYCQSILAFTHSILKRIYSSIYPD